MTQQTSPDISKLNTANNDDEIDLLALAKALWDARKTIIKITALFMVVGLFVAILTPKEFTASSVMVPQTAGSKSGLGNLSGLAAMAGINLGGLSSGSDLSPKLYPQIVSSIPFQLELMNTKFKFEALPDSVTLYDYFTKHQKTSVIGAITKYTVGLPGVIMGAIKGEPKNEIHAAIPGAPVQMTLKQAKVKKELAKLIGITVNDKDGYISLSGTMPEAVAAAEVAQVTQKLLQKYIIEFKIAKAQNTHDFVQGRYHEAREGYLNAQEKLASFRDRNKNVATAMAKTEEERLTGEFNLAYSVYSELAKQLEQVKLQLKEETPVFTIIEPVTVPTEKSKPKRALILIIWTFIGILVSVGFIIEKMYWDTIKYQWNSKKIATPELNN